MSKTWKYEKCELEWDWDDIRKRPLKRRNPSTDRDERNRVHSLLTEEAEQERQRIRAIYDELDFREQALKSL